MDGEIVPKSPKKRKIPPQDPEIVVLRKSMHKTMLLSGNSVSIIEQNPNMAMHFSFILLFCNSLIGYSLNCSQKGFIIRCLKSITNGLVMSVGDGFNDMSMIRESDVGV
jgi:P-type E1-E2 ATPase